MINEKGMQRMSHTKIILLFIGTFLLILLGVLYISKLGLVSSKKASITAEQAEELKEKEEKQKKVAKDLAVTDHPIRISNGAVDMLSIRAKAGSTVTWHNNDTTKHEIIAYDNSFTTGTINPGTSKSITLGKAGVFRYYSKPHPTTQGTIVVLP